MIPKDHGAVMAARGALQSARIGGLVEAMPRYHVSVPWRPPAADRGEARWSRHVRGSRTSVH